MNIDCSVIAWIEFFEVYEKRPLALANFFSHMKSSLKAEANLIAVADYLYEAIVDLLFFVLELYARVCRVGRLPHFLQLHRAGAVNEGKTAVVTPYFYHLQRTLVLLHLRLCCL